MNIYHIGQTVFIPSQLVWLVDGKALVSIVWVDNKINISNYLLNEIYGSDKCKLELTNESSIKDFNNIFLKGEIVKFYPGMIASVRIANGEILLISEYDLVLK